MAGGGRGDWLSEELRQPTGKRIVGQVQHFQESL